MKHHRVKSVIIIKLFPARILKTIIVVGAAVASGSDVRDVPHHEQNRPLADFPQDGQVSDIATPQVEQNRASGAFPAPQDSHTGDPIVMRVTLC